MSGTNASGHFKRLFARVNGAGFKAALVQNHGQRVGDHSFVVGDQHLGFHRVFRHSLLDGFLGRNVYVVLACLGVLRGILLKREPWSLTRHLYQ
jgi:hypothetical protein